jgi:hypothetical protein
MPRTNSNPGAFAAVGMVVGACGGALAGDPAQASGGTPVAETGGNGPTRPVGCRLVQPPREPPSAPP